MQDFFHQRYCHLKQVAACANRWAQIGSWFLQQLHPKTQGFYPNLCSDCLSFLDWKSGTFKPWVYKWSWKKYLRQHRRRQNVSKLAVLRVTLAFWWRNHSVLNQRSTYSTYQIADLVKLTSYNSYQETRSCSIAETLHPHSWQRHLNRGRYWYVVKSMNTWAGDMQFPQCVQRTKNRLFEPSGLTNHICFTCWFRN